MEDTGGRKPRVRDLNAHLICVLCGGYYVDATTIVECVHSFCRSCIVRHLETSKFCPICDVQVHKAKPLHSIRSDRILQTLAYKVVPGLYHAEMQRRREYNASSSTEPHADRSFFSPEDSISLSLEYYDSDNEDDADNTSENEIEKTKQMPHRRYLQCPAAVSMKHLKKFIRMKYGLSSEHRVDVIYAGECLKDDFSLMDVAYTFSWKRPQYGTAIDSAPKEVAPMRFSYRIFHPTIYVPATAPSNVTNTTLPEQKQCKDQDPQQEQEEDSDKQEQSVSPSHSVSIPESLDTGTTGVTSTVSTVAPESKDIPSEKGTPSPTPSSKETPSVMVSFPEDEVAEPQAKKIKLCNINVDENVKESTNANDTKSEQEEKAQQKVPVVVEEKRQKRKRKRSSNSDHERRVSYRDDETTDVDNSATAKAPTSVTTVVAAATCAAASPNSEVTTANEEAALPAVEVQDKNTSDELVVKHTCTEPEETQETPPPLEDEEVVEDSECVDASNAANESSEVAADSDVVGDNEAVADSEVTSVSAVNEESAGVTGAGEVEGSELDNEDVFAVRMSSTDEEEEEGGEEDVRLTTKIVPKQTEIKEDKHVKEVEERKKLKGKRDGRKKSKHKSKHHHQESSARKRKAHRSESTPTILQYQEDVMKLKVKLGPIKPAMSHRHHHHHHHSKHNRKAQQEVEAPSSNVGLNSNGESSNSANTTTSAKERLLQMRAVRHKNITTTKGTTPPAESTPVKEDVNSRSKKIDVLMPPSSITVSKVNIADKRKFETQKSTNNSSSATEEIKRPSLEIMLVNAPTTTTVSTTCTSTTTTTTTASNTSTETFVTMRHSSNNSTNTSTRAQEHGSFKPTRPPPPTIPLVRIKKTSMTSIRPPSGLTITPKIPITTSLPTKTSTTISKTPSVKVSAVTEAGGQTKEKKHRDQCGVIEEEQTMRHDDIGALDLSGKSSRCKSTSSPATSPSVATGFSSPPSPVLKSPGATTSSTHQSILSIAQSLVHRQLQQQKHGLINISSSSPGKVSKSSGADNVVGSVHSAVTASPVYAMSNLKTLSDTAVRIRNEMAAQSDKGIRSGGAVKTPIQQKQTPISVQMTSTSETKSPAPIIGCPPVAVTFASNSNPRSGLSQSLTRSPSGHQQYQSLSNNSVPPLRIPIPPTALSKAGNPPGSSTRASNLPRLHELFSTAQGTMGRGRGIVPGLQNRSGMNNHTKPGPNQAVRHIPNPSALLFRQQQTQNRMQQQNSSAQSRHAAVNKTLFNNQNNFNNNTTVKPIASTSLVTTAPPVSSIRKMENMTRNIEKVAAGLTVRAVEAHSK